MAPFRTRLGKLFRIITGGSGGAVFASGGSLARGGDVFFIVILIAVVLVSAALLKWIAADTVQFVLAALWALTVGGALLLYLPAKILITLIGSLLGIGASDLAGLAQVIEKMSTTVAAITKTINSAGDVQIHQQAVWLFLALVAVCCLPAYRNETGS